MAGIVCADCLKTSLIDNVKGRCASCYSRYLRSTKRIKALSCEVCRCRFQSARRDARFCSDACRQWSYRERRLLRMGWGRSNLGRDEEADRWSSSIRKKLELNTKSHFRRGPVPG